MLASSSGSVGVLGSLPGLRVGWKVWCAFPSGGARSAVLYACDVRGALCHLSAHVVMAESLAVSFCFLIVCGSSRLVRSAVRMASNASCLALLKPTKGIFFGSHCKTTLMLGCVLRSSPSILRCLRDTSCSSWVDRSSALLSAELEGSRRMNVSWTCAGLSARWRVMASKAGVSDRIHQQNVKVLNLSYSAYRKIILNCS